MIAVIGGRVLDSTALAAFAIGRPVYMRALVWAAVEANIVLAVPSAALGRAWGLVEQEHHDALRVLLDLPNTVIDELTPGVGARGRAAARRRGPGRHRGRAGGGLRRGGAGGPRSRASRAPCASSTPRCTIEELP